MIDQSKWAIAQAHEKEHWVKNHERYASDDFRMKQRLKAEQNERWISQFIELREDSRILEIGGAGEPIIDFFSRGRRTSLDPLNDFYSEQFPNLLDPTVRRVSATAEDIPFEDQFFDLIMIHNVLDHTRNPSQVLGELSRCLNVGGILAFSVNTFPVHWVWGRRLFPLLGGRDHLLHPHSFSVGRVFSQLKRAGFKILEAKLDLFVPRNWQDQKIGRVRRRLYSLSNYRRRRVSVIAGKSK
jgi:ubiquinone/menaquinone biosynthesis C-methylase UbiE